MAAPTLRIPLSVNMTEFEKGMEKARSTTANGVRRIASEFASLTGDLKQGAKAAEVLAGSFSRVRSAAVGIAAVTVAYSLLKSTIAAAHKQLEEMLDIAERSGRVGVSPAFFQAFIAGAKGAEEKVQDLENALTRAFQATKDVIAPDWSVWDQGLTKVTAVETALREMRELFSTDQKFTALDLFRSAGSQDQKILAVIAGMRELNAIGEKVAALDLGEKMFGSGFADKVRLGAISIDEMARTIETKLKSPDIISTANVQRAKELNDRLTEAWQTIENNLKPSWEGLGKIALGVKNIWVDIIELIAKATGAGGAAAIAAERDRAAQDQNDPNYAITYNRNLARQGQRARIARGNEYLDEGMSPEYSPSPGPPPPPSANVPLPRRRPDNIPDPKAETFKLEAIERYIESLERSKEIQEAEFKTIGLSNVEREKAVALANAQSAARRDGRELTAEEIANVERLATAHAKLGEQIKALREVQQAFKEFGSLMSEAFQGMLFHGQKLDQVLKNLSQRMAGKAMDKLFDMLMTQAGNAAVNGGFFSNLFGGARASGGPVVPGKAYLVNENTPRSELFIPKVAGTVVPNQLARSLGGGSNTTQVDQRRTFNIDARGAQAGVAQQIVSALRAYDRQLPGRIADMQMTGV